MNTNPSYQSAKYLKHSSQVSLVNDVYEGIDECKKHISQFPREVDSAYADRQDKATLKNFVQRIARSTRNIVINKPPNTDEINKKLLPLLEKVDRSVSFEAFLRQVALKQILDGHPFVCLDALLKDNSV